MKINYKIYTTVIVFFAIDLMLVIFFVAPFLTNIINIPNQTNKAKQESAEILSEIASLQDFDQKYKDYKTNFEKIDKLFVDYQNPVDFIKFLEGLSPKIGVVSSISSLSQIQKPDQDNAWPFCTLSISSTGIPEKIFEFSKELENNRFLIKIQSLNIQSLTIQNFGSANSEETPSQGQPSKVKANYVIKVFVKSSAP